MATETLRPNAAGDETSIPSQYPASDNHYDKVDEAEADDDTTYVYTIGAAYVRDLYNLPASSGSGVINFIKVYFRIKNSVVGYTATGRAAIKSGGTVTDGAEQSVDSSYTTFSQQWDTNPADGEAWEWSDIDALQIGVSIKRNEATGAARCTQVYVEVDYTSITEKSSSETGTGTDACVSLESQQDKTSADSGSGVDAVDSLETPEAKLSSDAGSGLEGTPTQSAVLVSGETGSGLEAIIARLLTDDESGGAVEAADVEDEGQLKDLFVTELGEGADCLSAKIEMPTKGGGMKLWT
ncbi:MAG TPA: hypothetical protein G4N91_01110 [Dehalococcoidia bacterium]|nr:hypothetical protein [Dehalococcoidia bacterium]